MIARSSEAGRQPRALSPTTWLVLIILLVGWDLRLVAYADGELGLDGHLSVGLALQPVGRLLSFLSRDVHPPLFYLLLKVWLGIVGVDPIGARWLSVAAGVLTLVLVYRLVASLAGPAGAVAALLLLALSPAQIAASATVRDFSLGLLLSVGTLVVWRALDQSTSERARRWLAVALSAVTALALATWYLHAVLLVIQAVDLLRRRAVWRWRVVALVVALVAQVPWLVLALPPLLGKLTGRVAASGQAPTAVEPVVVAASLARALAGTIPVAHLATIVTVPWLLLVALGLVQAAARRLPWSTLAGFGLLVGTGTVAGLVAVWASPTLLGRYALVILPWAALTQAWAFGSPQSKLSARSMVHVTGGRLVSWRLPVLLVGLALAVQIGDYVNLIELEGWPWTRQPPADPAFSDLAVQSQDGDAIIFTDLARTGQYALQAPHPLPSATLHVAGAAYLRDDVAGVAGRHWLAPLLADHPRVWLLYDQPADSTSLAEIDRQLLPTRALVGEEQRGPAVLQLFGPAAPLTHHPGDRLLGGMIDLADWGVDSEIAPGKALQVVLTWKTERQPDANYTVFAQLLDQQGQKVAQYDARPGLGLELTATWPPGQTVVDRFLLPVPPTTPPGTYHLVVGLYLGSQRLKLANGEDAVSLGPITVDGVNGAGQPAH